MAGDEPIEIELSDLEREFLRAGLVEWGGVARCTDQLAIAMGFDSVSDFKAETGRLMNELRSTTALPPADWLRILFATEIVFISEVVGAAGVWPTTTGFSDPESLSIIRGIQRKVGRAIPGLRRYWNFSVDDLGQVHLRED